MLTLKDSIFFFFYHWIHSYSVVIINIIIILNIFINYCTQYYCCIILPRLSPWIAIIQIINDCTTSFDLYARHMPPEPTSTSYINYILLWTFWHIWNSLQDKYYSILLSFSPVSFQCACITSVTHAATVVQSSKYPRLFSILLLSGFLALKRFLFRHRLSDVECPNGRTWIKYLS